MSGMEAIRSLSLDQRVVLLGVAELAERDETPANPAEVRQVCNDHLALEDGPVFGRLAEADVTRALYGLEEADLLRNEGPEDTSPTGKGRPLYVPAPDVEDVRETLAEDDDLEPVPAALN